MPFLMVVMTLVLVVGLMVIMLFRFMIMSPLVVMITLAIACR